MDLKIKLWWDRLEENEQNILISLLYDLDLRGYVVMDKYGKITSIQN